MTTMIASGTLGGPFEVAGVGLGAKGYAIASFAGPSNLGDSGQRVRGLPEIQLSGIPAARA